MNKVLYSLYIITILSCNNYTSVSTENESLQLVDSVAFNTKMMFRGRYTGSFYHQEQQCYYFADPVSAKKLRAFEQDGQFIEEINLSNVVNKGGGIDCINVMALDTVLVLTKYTNILYCLNRRGEIWKQLDLSDYLPQNDSYSCEVMASSQNISFRNNSLLLSYNSSFKEYKDSPEAFLGLVAHKWKANYFVRLDNIWSDSLRTTSGFRLYQHIYPKDSINLTLDRKEYVIADSSVLLASMFSDQLFKVDLNSFALFKKQRVISDHDSFEAHPMNVKELGFETAFDSSITRVHKTALISGLQYNPVLEHYYVSIVKKQKRPFDPLETKVPFLFLVYDKELNQLLDIDIDVDKYAGVTFPTHNGFMIQTRASANDFENKRAVFHEFVY